MFLDHKWLSVVRATCCCRRLTSRDNRLMLRTRGIHGVSPWAAHGAGPWMDARLTSRIKR
jgi:hypothetical protein